MSDIEKRARELLATAVEQAAVEIPGVLPVSASIRAGGNAGAQFTDVAISAIIAALTPPDGWVLVPLEWTQEMWDAAVEESPYENVPGAIWRAMIEARPEVP